MPVITIEAGVLNLNQKRALVKEVVESAAKIMRMPEKSIYVFIKENQPENIGVGCELLADAHSKS